MKKVLFATTALIATASMAAADVRISGYGRFGLDYNSNNSTDVNDANFNGVSSTNLTSRLRLQFDMSAETDGGVAFDARLRFQSEFRDGSGTSNGGAGTTIGNAARFGVVWEGLRVNVGNIIGAVENTPGLYTTGISAGTGIDGMGYWSVPIKGAGWDAYSSGGAGSAANGVEALYTAGGFVGHVSWSRVNGVVGGPTTAPTFTNGEERFGLMLTYNFGDMYVGGSYQSSSNGPTLATTGGGTVEANDGLYLLTFGGDWGQWGGRIAYAKTEAAKSWTLEGNVDIGAASNLMLWVNDASTNSSITAAAQPVTDGTSYGINYQYDLGGGATFVAGYVRDAGKENQFQAGAYFSF
ncbi:porin [Primorskyibacter sp. S87]|uniref:porin n=1 Tax=Primorskyibacter sp. S87 TaxID=3415126 RepID=UPI003C7CC7B5